MKFGIRFKTTLLVLVLSLTLAIFIPWMLKNSTKEIVENHEVVDLSEETALKAWGFMEQIQFLREDARLCARRLDAAFFEKIAEAKQSRADAIAALITGNLEAEAEKLKADNEKDSEFHNKSQIFRQQRNYLSLDIIQGEVERSVFPRDKPIGSEERETLGAGELEMFRAQERVILHSEERDALLRELDDESYHPGEVRLSRITKIRPDETNRGFPVIWAAVALPNESGGAGAKLVFAMRLSDNTSPRHLTYLMDPDDRILIHPDLNPPGTFEKDTIFGAEIHKEYQKTVAEIAEKVTRARGGGGSEVQRFPVWQRQRVQKPYYFLEGTPNDEVIELIRTDKVALQVDVQKAIQDLAGEFQDNGKQYDRRFGGMTNNVEVVRLLCNNRQDIEKFREAVETALENAPVFKDVYDGIDWNPIVKCETGDVCMVVFPVESGGKITHYRLLYSAFREELGSNVDAELSFLTKVAIFLSILVAILAFIASTFVVLPLLKITRTAREVTAFEGGALQNKIETVRKSLPVKRNDEAGGIARALERLLVETLNGHEQLRQAKADTDLKVVEQTKELREANNELQTLAKAKDTFLASVSHDLRQPLNSIFGFLQFLEFSELTGDQKRDVGKIRSAATYLIGLVNDILDYQKIIMGGLKLEPESIDVPALLDEIKHGLEMTAKERNNTLEAECEPGLETISNDKKRIQQILTNVTGNACKFTSDGRITIRAARLEEEDRDWITIDIADTGRGMKPEEKQNIFVPFKKLASKEGNRSGTGLGLVISKGLAELMGGDITFESEFGKGTTFTLRVPAEVDAEGAGEAAVPAATRPALKPKRAGAPVHSKRRAGGTGRTVLVIDDDEQIREMMIEYLTKQGFQVLEASDGVSGFEKAKAKQPDIITLDVVMPQQDGWSVLDELKSDPGTSGIPVVMVTFLEEENRGFALGAADYIVKPIDWKGLTSVLGQFLVPGEKDHKILVIEDDRDTRAIYRRALTRGGWQVIEASNGSEGLTVLEKETPSCILLDLMMPVMDGFEFIAEYNRHPEWSSIPIIVITAKSSTGKERELLMGSVEAILEKGGQVDLLDELLRLVDQLSSPVNGDGEQPPANNKD